GKVWSGAERAPRPPTRILRSSALSDEAKLGNYVLGSGQCARARARRLRLALFPLDVDVVTSAAFVQPALPLALCDTLQAEGGPCLLVGDEACRRSDLADRLSEVALEGPLPSSSRASRTVGVQLHDVHREAVLRDDRLA